MEPRRQATAGCASGRAGRGSRRTGGNRADGEVSDAEAAGDGEALEGGEVATGGYKQAHSTQGSRGGDEHRRRGPKETETRGAQAHPGVGQNARAHLNLIPVPRRERLGTSADDRAECIDPSV